MKVNVLRNKLADMQSIDEVIKLIEEEALKGKITVTFQSSQVFPNCDVKGLNPVQVRKLRNEGFKVKKDSGISQRLIVSGWV